LGVSRNQRWTGDPDPNSKTVIPFAKRDKVRGRKKGAGKGDHVHPPRKGPY